LKQPRRQLFVLAQNLAPGRHTVEFVCAHHEGTGSAAGPVRLVGIAGIGVPSNQR
jgi:hypothetical protein